MITDTVFTKIVAFLTPLFLDTCCGDIDTAHASAATVLASYNVRTDHELRFAALVLAFSLSALDALARAVKPDLTENQVLRLRGNANALNRAALQNQKALDDLQSDRLTSPDEPLAELSVSNATSDLVSFTRSARAAVPPATPSGGTPSGESAQMAGGGCPPCAARERPASAKDQHTA